MATDLNKDLLLKSLLPKTKDISETGEEATNLKVGFLEKHKILGFSLLILAMIGFTGSLVLIKYI
jgi:hypothetical protein